MANTKKASPAKKSSTASKARSPKSAEPPPAPTPIRRELGAGVFLFLTLLMLISYFNTDGSFIAFFTDLMKGLLGGGFHLLAPCFLICAFILAFHRGKPVSLRVSCALLLPMLFAGMQSLLLYVAPAGKFDLTAVVGDLFLQGQQGGCGGVVGGLLGLGLEKAFSVYGAFPLLLVLFILCLCKSLKFSLSDAAGKLKTSLLTPYPEEEIPPARQTGPAPTARTADKKATPIKQTASRRTYPLDIPLGEEEEALPLNELEDSEELFEPKPTPRKARVRKKAEETASAAPVVPAAPARTGSAASADTEPMSFEEASAFAGIDVGDGFVEIPNTARRVKPAPVVIGEISDPPRKKAKKEELAAEAQTMADSISEAAEKEIGEYRFPPVELLNSGTAGAIDAKDEIVTNKERLEGAIRSFGINAGIVGVIRGPTVTRYDIELEQGVKLSRVTNLAGDLALALGVINVRIAPIPDKISTVGIEVPNKIVSTVYLRDIIDSDAFSAASSKLTFALGKDIGGNAIVGNIAKLPHLLIAGTTGSGKSVCINSMILSMLYKFRPEELRLILVDPKVVEMQPYRKLPHLACPVVTVPNRVIGALRWAVNEMERRYRMFSMVGVRTFKDYNARNPLDDPRPEPPPAHEELYTDDRMASSIIRDIEDSNDGRDIPDDDDMEQGELDLDRPDELPDKIPYIVIIIDELADLMQVVKEDLENYIARLTQKARAAGIHLVAATQTPRSNVVTGLIKANIPSRIAFRVASPLDSRIILDTTGAENLLGKGDSLFVPPDGLSKMTRVQGAFVSDAEIQQIIDFCAKHAEQHFEQGVTAEMNNSDDSVRTDNERIAPKAMSGDDAELYERCVNLVITERKASTSLLQRRFSIGYGKAAKIMDQMEENGIIGPSQGASRPREILVDEA